MHAPSDRHLFSRFLAKATATPEQPFCHIYYRGRHEVVNCGDLLTEAREHAGGLQAIGVQAGCIVPIILEHRRELYSCFIGCTLLGAVPAFLPPMTAKQDAVVFRQSMAALLERIDATCIVISDASALAIEDCGPTNTYSVDSRVCSVPLLDTCATEPDDIAFLQHTSGTTGLKKGVCLTHRAALRQIEVYGAAIGLTTEDVIASWLPLYHDMGLITSFLMPAVLGVPFISLDAFEWVMRPAMLLDHIAIHKATLCWLPNFAFHHIVKTLPRQPEWDLSSLRLVINCSEPCRHGAFEQFIARLAGNGVRGDVLGACYAMAENVFAVTQTIPGSPPRPSAHPDWPGYASSGPVLPQAEVRVIDHSGAEVAPGNVGQILIRSNCLFSGYFRQPELSAARLKDGWYLTGDIGYYDNGELFVVGRNDDVLNINGKKLVAHEVEEVVNGVPGLAPGRVLVFAKHDEQLGVTEMFVAVENLEEAPLKTELTSAIRRAINGNCGIYPRRILFLPRGFLIKSTSGKISRQASVDKLCAGEWLQHPI